MKKVVWFFLLSVLISGCTTTETGQVDVTFIEQIVDPEDPTDPESGKTLVPFGSFSYMQNTVSGGSMSPLPGFVASGTGRTVCNASDNWERKKKSKKGYASLSLTISGPEKEEEVTQSDLNMLPPEMRQQMSQLMAMTQNMQGQMESMGMLREPEEGELKYDLRMYFDSMPAQFTVNTNNAGGSTEATQITPEPIELEGIFRATETEIPLSKTINIPGGSARLQGTLKLRPQ